MLFGFGPWGLDEGWRGGKGGGSEGEGFLTSEGRRRETRGGEGGGRGGWW